ncbi:MAG: hypothetical protein HY336_01885 [Candidatus Doudnabacteria bacterium]|nr:hypothetical protein [Candidatus Doudnabacteria bacterium]
MAKAIAPSVSVEQSESKIAGLLDQLKAVIRHSGLNDDQLQAIRDSGRLPVDFEPVFAKLAAVVCNAIRLTISTVKAFEKPSWMKRLVRGNDPVTPGIYEYTFEGFLREGEESVKGDEMVARAKASGAYSGLQHALYFLDNQHLIPEEFRDKKYLIFADTEALNSNDRSDVACLAWGGLQWILYWRLLVDDFNRNDLLVRARKVQ